MKVRNRKRLIANKKRLIANKAKRKDPIRLDPTRTVGLRKQVTKEMRRRFRLLKGRIIKLVVDEDSFGLKERKPLTIHGFCPTGEGGGRDNSCGSRSATQEQLDPEKFPTSRLKDRIKDWLRVLPPEEKDRVESIASQLRSGKETPPVVIRDYGPKSVTNANLDQPRDERGRWAEGGSDGGDDQNSGKVFLGKTQWSSDGLAKRGIKEHDFVKQKRTELEKNTGVPWSAHTGQGKIIFQPYLSSKDVEAKPNQAIEEKITNELKKATGINSYVSYLDIHRRTGVPLKEIMPVVKDMLHGLRAAATVDRMGYNTAIKLKKPPTENEVRELLNEQTDNAFCPTGEGGGVDPSCPPKGGNVPNEQKLGPAATKRPAKQETAAVTPDQLHTLLHTVRALDRRGFNFVSLEQIRPALPWDRAAADQVIARAWHDHLISLPQNEGRGGVPEGELRASFRDDLDQPGRERTYSHVEIRPEGQEYAAHAHAGGPTKNHGPVLNQPWQFTSDPEQVVLFQQWLKLQFASLLVGQNEEQLWSSYIQEGYRRGAGRAFDDVRRSQLASEHPELFDPESQQSLSDFYTGSKDEFLRSSFAQPVAVEKVKLLAGRAFDELEGITQQMSLRMSRVLTDGLVQGKGPREVASDLNNEVDLGEGRAETVARTEIIRAHAEGQLSALEDLGVEEVGVAVEWSTADDEDVCPICEDLEGVVLTIDEARGMLPRHPRCRCAWIPANVGEDKKDQKRSKKQIDAALDDAGVDVDIDKQRPQSILNVFDLPTTATPLDEFSYWLTTGNARSFFADCERDEHGHCLGEGSGDGGSAGDAPASSGNRFGAALLQKARKLAKAKARANPTPTPEEVAAANKRMDDLGADDYEMQIRGKSSDRAASRKKLLAEFGDGEHCPCVYCGLKLDNSSVTRDKILTAREGGRYRHSNLLPACLECNKSRGDVKFKDIKWSKL